MTTPAHELRQKIYTALQTYSNVHRGSGHFSQLTSRLYDQARSITAGYLKVDPKKYTVIFCSPARAEQLSGQLPDTSYRLVRAKDIGLSLGVCALAVKRSVLPDAPPRESGGGTARLSAPGWVLWAKGPDRYEAGTPAIINCIAFAAALQMQDKQGGVFAGQHFGKSTAREILFQDEFTNLQGPELIEKLRESCIGRAFPVPTREGMKPFIQFDNSASTPTFEPVWEAFFNTLLETPEVQQEVIREVRQLCAEIFDAPESEYDILFTSNTTESVNLVARNLNALQEPESEPVIVSSLLEHTSNDLPWRSVPAAAVVRLKIDKEGFVDSRELETLLRTYNQQGSSGKKRIKLVAISGASNVLGTCNDLTTLSALSRKYGACFLTDGAQLVAHRPVKMKQSGIDIMAFSGHKCYAPFGTGVLICRKTLLGQSPETGKLMSSSGEENPGGIAALGKAMVLLNRVGMDCLQQAEHALTARALAGMAGIPGLRIHGIRDSASPAFAHKTGVIAFEMKKRMSDKISRELALQRGIGTRYGCHCAHILVKHLIGIKPSLEKIQRLILILFPKLSLPGVARVSFGIHNTPEEVDVLLQVLQQIAEKQGPGSKGQSGTVAPDILKTRIQAFEDTMVSKVFS